MSYAAQLGMQAAGQIMGAGMGMMIGDWNDERQRKQQEYLQKLQVQGQKDMMDYGYGKQLQMWKDTSYGPQIEQMNKAGVNPGMIYGMSGGGGQTTGNASGSVSGATAQQNPGEIQASMGMGMQMAQMAAQTALTQAQTEKAKVETTKTAGVDTKEAEARTESIWQGLDNARNTYELQRLEMTMKNIENFEKQESQGDRLAYIEYQARIAEKQMRIIGNEQKISDETINSNINRIKAEAIGAVLRNELTKASTDKTKTAIQLDYKQMNKIAQEIMMGWDRVGQGNQEIEIRRILQQYNTDPTKDAMNDMIETIGDIMKQKRR